MSSKYNIVFFGTSDFAVSVLDELKKEDIVPSLIITAPDRPKGRGLRITPPPTKVWAEENSIDIAQPDNPNASHFIEEIGNSEWHLFTVASYGKILSEEILSIPKHGTLNVHPSLLPKLRGASPIQTAILNDEKDAIGITIMLVDEELDHGPIIAQASIELDKLPKASVLEELLAQEGGKLLAEIIPLWVRGKITPLEQVHKKATYSKKVVKEDGLIDLGGDAYENFRKIQAFDVWPGTYFFAEKNKKKVRVKIADASLKDGELIIERVIPEGKKEMLYADFLKGN